VRVGFLCMESVFSVRPLEALLAAGHDVRFVMRPIGGMETRTKGIIKRHRGFDVAVRRALGLGQADDDKRNPLVVAARADIPAYLVGNASAGGAVALLKRERVDIVVVAFFNQLLKPAFLEVPRLGALNLHPSLLPRYRGPAPLFWTYRDGCTETGLTLHRVSPGEDDGDVLSQERVPLPLELPGEELVDDLASRAARMTVDALHAIESGSARFTPQDPALVTRAPRPTEQDLRVDASMGARRAFQFVRGVGRWNPVYVDTGSQRVRVVDAVELQEGQRMPREVAVVGDLLHLGCEDGVVVLRTRAALTV
jgi:methionyl-tRNA formyltransferase